MIDEMKLITESRTTLVTEYFLFSLCFYDLSIRFWYFYFSIRFWYFYFSIRFWYFYFSIRFWYFYLSIRFWYFYFSIVFWYFYFSFYYNVSNIAILRFIGFFLFIWILIFFLLFSPSIYNFMSHYHCYVSVVLDYSESVATCLPLTLAYYGPNCSMFNRFWIVLINVGSRYPECLIYFNLSSFLILLSVYFHLFFIIQPPVLN